MRISDWSSDVCSSDLSLSPSHRGAVWRRSVQQARTRVPSPSPIWRDRQRRGVHHHPSGGAVRARRHNNLRETRKAPYPRPARSILIHADRKAAASCRSEEHTSELQSLMRISYAVFCLKKKNKKVACTKDII